jgi:tetratricopeptide (TPR) repeat protein
VDERDAAITTDAIRLHRLVREIAAARREGEARDTLRQVLVAALVAPNDGYDNPASWPRCGLLTPHLLVTCETEMADAATNGECAALLDRAGSYFEGRGIYSVVRPLFERALAINEKVLGPEHPETANSLNRLASLLWIDLTAARPLLERALAIREKVLGPEHPETATGLKDFADLLHDQGDFAAARPLYERALAIREKVLGPEHPYTAHSLSTIQRTASAPSRACFEIRATLRARGRSSSALWRSLRRCSAPSMTRRRSASAPSRACFEIRATLRGHGRSKSALWRSMRRCSAL